MDTIKSFTRVCSAALLMQLPAGCLPKGAEPLTAEQTQKVQDSLDGAAEHLDLFVTMRSSMPMKS